MKNKLTFITHFRKEREFWTVKKASKLFKKLITINLKIRTLNIKMAIIKLVMRILRTIFMSYKELGHSFIYFLKKLKIFMSFNLASDLGLSNFIANWLSLDINKYIFLLIYVHIYTAILFCLRKHLCLYNFFFQRARTLHNYK